MSGAARAARRGWTGSVGRNPTRYVGLKNGEKLYYVLEGDTLRSISAEEAFAK